MGKKIKSLISASLISLLFASIASAQTGTATFNAVEDTYTRIIVVTIEWTADGSGDVSANFDADIIEELYTRHCYFVETWPGSTAPTALYDIVIADEQGQDIFGGQLANRSATVAEIAAPKINPVYGGRTCTNTWTLSISNAGAAGQGEIELLFR